MQIPRFLLERWSKVDKDDVHLANIRIYHNAVNPATGRVPRIILTLPSHAPTTANDPDEPDIFELDMVNESVSNQLVIAERPKDPSNPVSRARTTILTGKVKHECNVRPRFSEGYRQRMRDRTRAAGTPSRQIVMMEDAMGGGQGKINQLSSGVANGRGFSDLVVSRRFLWLGTDHVLYLSLSFFFFFPQKQKQKPIKGTFERMARMPRNQLLDALFALFRERAHWPIRLLRDRVQQPEVYLKEVMAEVAFLHRSGEHAGTWELKANFKEDVSVPVLSVLVFIGD